MGFFKVQSPRQTTTKRPSTSSKSSKHVTFTDSPPLRHSFSFDWSLENAVWYDRTELNSFKEGRFEDADALRKVRGVHVSSRNLMDNIEDELERDEFIGDEITHALDDADDNGEVSLRGIEHFVFPVLQKEMIRRKKELKMAVVEMSKSHNAKNAKNANPKDHWHKEKKDPKKEEQFAEELAEVARGHSQWARDVASERGIKYCQMKRGGGLLKNTRTSAMGRRNLGGSLTGSMIGGGGGRNLMAGLGKGRLDRGGRLSASMTSTSSTVASSISSGGK